MTHSTTILLPPRKDSTIAVAISGGVDSLYTLLSLKKQGANIFAVHGLFGQRILAEFMEYAGLPAPSPSFDELLVYMQDICAKLGIPFHLIDCENLFLAKVITPFVQTYIEGGTPNPCALCNATVKLGNLLEQCLHLGADFLATGHYAQCLQTTSGPILLQGSDPTKDQSYFLALTPAEYLSKIIFPIGLHQKKDILAELTAQGSPLPQQGESQEICFIPGNLYREFLPFMAQKLGMPLPPGGRICLEDGTCLGSHAGLWHFTEGQRRGIGIGWKEPLHVLAKEQAENILRVGPKSAVLTTSLTCDKTNILIDPQTWPETVLVKARYREHPRQAKIRLEQQGNTTSMTIIYDDPHTAVSCGQLATVYIPYEKNPKGQLCVAAGGIITHSSSAS